MQRLPYLAEPAENSLRRSISANLERYRSGDFTDLAARSDWNLQCRFEYDPTPLLQLSGGASNDLPNALLVWQSLSRMTTSLACEGRIWTRLAHVECLGYLRSRWPAGADDDRATAQVEKHWFCRTLTGRRDDHAISRLWWSAWIARQASPDHDIRPALSLILKTTDIRSNLVERPMMMSRPLVARAVIQGMTEFPEVHASEARFRSFMKILNRRGSGAVFECKAPDSVLDLVRVCAEEALQISTAASS